MLEIDGSFGEGGGQILRTTLSLAALTGCEVGVTNIRAARDKPGLRPQHLTAVLAVADICSAEVAGAEVGATSLVFRPRKVRGGTYEFDVSKVRASAGSTTLVLQTVLWPLAFSGKTSRVILRGGTHVPHAPAFNYIDEVFLPTIAHMGLVCHCRMTKAGYYPIGGGELLLEIRPVGDLMPLDLSKRAEPLTAELTSAVSNLPDSIAERQLNTGVERLRALGLHWESRLTRYPSPGRGTVFFAALRADKVRAGFQSLGELHKPAEKVAADACNEMEAYLQTGMALDKHLADQLIVPMALARGFSRLTTCQVTRHLLTNVAVVEKLLDVHFHVTGAIGEPGCVERVEA